FGNRRNKFGNSAKQSEKKIELINSDPQITAPKIAMELSISTRGVEKNLCQLREAGIQRRIGSPTFGGYWEITVTKEDK
ncbi:MAG: HTH domain-containing protein, partial [Prevotella sp.]|nr:HTH domain-containing protein [Prevotella sp.]